MARVSKVRITRPAGRRTKIEQRITASLVETANRFRRWLIDNDRVATGRAAGSLNVVITRQPKPLKSVSKGLTSAARSIGSSGEKADKQLATDIRKARTIFNSLDLGIVSGQIKAAPHFSFAMQGRGPGLAPPVEEILKWMTAKKVKPLASSMRSSAFLIARKIGREGTAPPHWTGTMTTTIVRFSTKRMVNAISKPLAKKIGRRTVRWLLAMGEDLDNMEFRSSTVTLADEALDEQLAGIVI